MEQPYSQSLYDFVNVKPEDVPFSNTAYENTRKFVHYYRFQDAYNTYLHQKTYHSWNYMFFPFDYASISQNRGENIDYTLFTLRNEKVNIVNYLRTSYDYFHYDRNQKIYHVLRNLLKQMYYYVIFINSKVYFTQESENIHVLSILQAYHLFEYLLENEDIISNEELTNLLNEDLPVTSTENTLYRNLM